MRRPDFLVVGAQKSGTTSLFIMLSRHPDTCLPARKEIQFFSSHALYPKGMQWYCDEHFSDCSEGKLAGEVSPQYMYSTEIARRIHADLSNVKIIMILREPVARAYSHYLMSVRRGQETRTVEEAFAASIKIDETDTTAPEAERYFQFSDYARVVSTYLELFGREQLLILFQEDLDRAPVEVMGKVTEFLGLTPMTGDRVEVRAHRSGTVRYRRIDRLMKSPSVLRQVLRSLLPRRLRPTLMFWLEQLNIKPTASAGLPEELKARYSDVTRVQVDFLRNSIDIEPPWDVRSS